MGSSSVSILAVHRYSCYLHKVCMYGMYLHTTNQTNQYFSNIYLKRYKCTFIIAKIGSSQARD